MMHILGLNAYHGDASACLFADGRIVAAAEEERFRRVKHWAGLPSEAVRWCLADADTGLADVVHVAVNAGPRANLWRRAAYALLRRPDLRLVLDRIRNQAKRQSVEDELRHAFPDQTFRGRVHRVEHHMAHLASCFLVSPFGAAERQKFRAPHEAMPCDLSTLIAWYPCFAQAAKATLSSGLNGKAHAEMSRSRDPCCYAGIRVDGMHRDSAASSKTRSVIEPTEKEMGHSERITIDPEICHGKPCIRGLRYPVENILEWLAGGMTIEEILADYEDLEREDILAALGFAARVMHIKRIERAA